MKKSWSSCIPFLTVTVIISCFITPSQPFSLPPASRSAASVRRQWRRLAPSSSSRTTYSKSTTSLGPVVVGNADASNPLAYSEQSRRYRRDFFTHDSWLRHRSKDRFVETLIKILDSHFMRHRVRQVLVRDDGQILVLMNITYSPVPSKKKHHLMITWHDESY